MADADVTSPPPFLLLTVLDCSITKRYTVTPPLTLFVFLNPFPLAAGFPSSPQRPKTRRVLMPPPSHTTPRLPLHVHYLLMLSLCTRLHAHAQTSSSPEILPMCCPVALRRISQTQIRSSKIFLLLHVCLCFNGNHRTHPWSRHFQHMTSEIITFTSDNCKALRPISYELSPQHLSRTIP